MVEALESQGRELTSLTVAPRVDVADLPEDVREAAGDREQLFAVHDSDGQQLALVADRKMAFVLARQNDMQPVTVH